MATPEATKDHPMLKKGSIHLSSHLLRLLDEYRPENPIAFMYAQLHRSRCGMKLNKEQLHEFLAQCTDVTPELLLQTLFLSLPDEVPDLRDIGWREITFMAADLLMAAFKTESALPTEASVKEQQGKSIPLLLALILNIARSKFVLQGLKSSGDLAVNVCVVLGPDMNTAAHGDALRSVAEANHAGSSLVSAAADEIRFVSKGAKNVKAELTFVDTTSNGRLADLAQEQLQHTVGTYTQPQVNVVVAPDFSTAVDKRVQVSRNGKPYDAVLVLRHPQLSHAILQLGTILAPLFEPVNGKGSPKPKAAFVDPSGVSAGSLQRAEGDPLAWPFFSFLVQRLLHVDMPQRPPALFSEVVALEGNFAATCAGVDLPALTAPDSGSSTLLQNLDLFMRAVVATSGAEVDYEKGVSDCPAAAAPASGAKLYALKPAPLPQLNDYVVAVQHLATTATRMKVEPEDAAPPPTTDDKDGKSGASKSGEESSSTALNTSTAPLAENSDEPPATLTWAEVFDGMTEPMWSILACNERLAVAAGEALRVSGGSVREALSSMPSAGVLSHNKYALVPPQSEQSTDPKAPASPTTAASPSKSGDAEKSQEGEGDAAPGVPIQESLVVLDPAYIWRSGPWAEARRQVEAARLAAEQAAQQADQEKTEQTKATDKRRKSRAK